MNGIIFDTEEAAKDWDWQSNQLTGSVTRYRFTRKPLTQTTELTKAEYAEMKGIAQVIPDGEEGTIPNPAYTALDDSYTVRKFALIVGDALNEYDEEGNVTVPDEIVDVSELIYVSEEL